MTSEGERRSLRRRRLWKDLAGSVVLIVALAVVVYWRFGS
jgi:hypothetical protein